VQFQVLAASDEESQLIHPDPWPSALNCKPSADASIAVSSVVTRCFGDSKEYSFFDGSEGHDYCCLYGSHHDSDDLRDYSLTCLYSQISCAVLGSVV